MFCWKCKAKIDLPEKKLGFRACCERCGNELHSCKNCNYYSPGKPNDCSYPDTLYVADREKNNFCEEFSPLEMLKEVKSSRESVAKRLFGEEDVEKKKDFRSLFDEEK